MKLVSAINSRRLLGLLVFMLASLLGLFLLPPIVQNQNYHDFADQRTLVRHTQFLECGLEHSFHRHRCLRTMAIWSFPGNHAALPRHFSDRFRLGLLSPRTK